jgi:hypothetical protein
VPRAAVDIGELLDVPGIRRQMLQAVDELYKVQNKSSKRALGQAYKICHTWQHRFEYALNHETPDWTGLAAFRCTEDFNLTAETVDKLKRAALPTRGVAKPKVVPKELTSLEECWRAYVQYLDEKNDLHSGKFVLLDRAIQSWFLEKLDACEPMLGGQAGNIAFLWLCLGFDPVVYTTHLSKSLTDLPVKQPNLGNIRVLQFEKHRGEISQLGDIRGRAGVLSSDGVRTPAPSAVSLTAVKGGRRIIYALPGLRVLEPSSEQTIDWVQVQFFYRGETLLDKPMKRIANDPDWPSIPLFCECRINTRLKQLEIHIVSEEELATTFENKVNFAVLGGIDAIYYDPWLQKDLQLQGRLLNLLEKQLSTLTACGVRLGVELSAIPAREYLLFLQRMCKQGVIGTLGVNGIDELPRLTGEAVLKKQLFDLWLDPKHMPEQIRAEANQAAGQGKHFEYLTYRRGQKLATATNVRTLYIHTLTLDFVLRRDTDPGAVSKAQEGDMMGKGFVIAALLQRAYGRDWRNELKKMPLAINPKAMAKLGQFARDFEAYEEGGAAERLLNSGYWFSSSSNQYLLAVVPVMWPPVSEIRAAGSLPERLNPTGAGDMTFGAFFLLSGV